MSALKPTDGYLVYHGFDPNLPSQRQGTTAQSNLDEAVSFVMERLTGSERTAASIEGPDGTIQYDEISRAYWNSKRGPSDA